MVPVGRRSPPKLGIDEPAVFVPERKMEEASRDAEVEAEVIVGDDWA